MNTKLWTPGYPINALLYALTVFFGSCRIQDDIMIKHCTRASLADLEPGITQRSQS